jgi:hypothetical protein
MSKSYGNYKTVGICTGSNTEFYKERRKHQRRVNKNRIRNVIANNEADDFDDKFIPYNIPKKDDWEEPTDGTIMVKAKDLENKECYKGIYTYKSHKIKK